MLSLKYTWTQLLSELAAQLAITWQDICQGAGSSPSLSHCHFSSLVFACHLSVSVTLTRLRSDCQVSSMLSNWTCTSRFMLATSHNTTNIPFWHTYSFCTCTRTHTHLATLSVGRLLCFLQYKVNMKILLSYLFRLVLTQIYQGR